MSLSPFRYREIDLVLSFRYYLMSAPVRDKKTLVQLYPDMALDTLQKGVRIGDLYTEEKLPSYPALGILCGGLVGQDTSFGFATFRYAFFVDAACLVKDSFGHIDRPKTETQRASLLGDLRVLLFEPTSRNIPFYTFNQGGGKTLIPKATFAVSRNPSPRIMESPARSVTTLNLAADLQLDVTLMRRG